jgi:uncharacterized protein (TIGR00251 family)
MRIQVKVKPNSNKESVEKIDNTYIVNIKEKAEKGRANIALIKLLAKYFKVSSSNIKIRQGLTSRNKILEINQH